MLPFEWWFILSTTIWGIVTSQHHEQHQQPFQPIPTRGKLSTKIKVQFTLIEFASAEYLSPLY